MKLQSCFATKEIFASEKTACSMQISLCQLHIRWGLFSRKEQQKLNLQIPSHPVSKWLMNRIVGSQKHPGAGEMAQGLQMLATLPQDNLVPSTHLRGL